MHVLFPFTLKLIHQNHFWFIELIHHQHAKGYPEKHTISDWLSFNIQKESYKGNMKFCQNL